ncbi:hypothetical protein SLS53_005444 [Cytospora paraplurivora]|uniref:Amidase domain-containing protein n=1 Tax=Cytospora paraplurivora TaxID=2898453 RepID=A0AAN9UC84_9PEZI
MLVSYFLQKLGALARIRSSWNQEAFLAPATSSILAVDGNPFPSLIEATLEDLLWGLDTGLFTSVDLVNSYTARILEVNSRLRVVNELNPDAFDIAAGLDAERALGALRGPLHGIPILIKDNIATGDKMNNTAGSYALLGSEVPEDSTVVAKLREAGAVILGKLNLSEWAHCRSSNSSGGWSALGGQTLGAYYPGQAPSGSSSGSGVASSIGLSWATLGTETAGSILLPSAKNNIVGIKPTVGLTSRHLVIPISEHQDTIGPMARTVKDAAILLSAIAGVDPKDNYTSAIPFKSVPNYVEACGFDSLRGKRIGVPRTLLNITYSEYTYLDFKHVMAEFSAALDILRDAGATVIDNITLPGYHIQKQTNHTRIVWHADFNTNLAEYLSKLTVNPHNITSVSDLQVFTRVHPLEEYPERDTDVWQASIDLGFGNDAPEFWPNYLANLYNAGLLGITGALRNSSLDALVVPTDFAPVMPAVIGSPVITVPLGRFPDNTTVRQDGFWNLNNSGPNFPHGISFMGTHFDEFNLIGLAYAFEQRTLVRDKIVPYIQPATELVDVMDLRKIEVEL